MTSNLHFLISAIRAIIEMLGLCLIAQGVMYLLAGQQRQQNPVYQLFALITAAPMRLAGALLPTGASATMAGLLCFLILFVSWIGLAVLRKFI